MDKIMAPTIEKIHSLPRGDADLGFLMTLDSGFHYLPSDGTILFRYRGTMFKPCEINYIAQGYAHQYMGLSKYSSIGLVLAHNHVVLPILDLLTPFDEQRLTPTEDELMFKILATAIGYYKYDPSSADW